MWLYSKMYCKKYSKMHSLRRDTNCPFQLIALCVPGLYPGIDRVEDRQILVAIFPYQATRLAPGS